MMRDMPDEPLTIEEVADRAGVDAAFVRELVDVGILSTNEEERFVAGDARRAMLVEACARAGLSVASIATALDQGTLTLATLDAPYYERWGERAETTYGQLTAQLGVPEDFFVQMRTALGFPGGAASDRPRRDEVDAVPVMAVALQQMPLEVLLGLFRVYGHSLRRIAAAETQAWHEYVDVPLQRAGLNERQVLEAGTAFGAEMMRLVDRQLLSVYRQMQESTWMADLVEHVERSLEQAGVHHRLERPPAMAFVDLSGFTGLTEEGGDQVAAVLAGRLTELVLGTATHHGGQAVKFLGDGVMFHFKDPAEGVEAVLEIVERTVPAGLPPAHVGMHAGPVVLREGDYFGRTVNWAARISGVAGPGEVLTTLDVVDAASTRSVRFDSIGKVDLKGIVDPVELYRAMRSR
jgi:adenylate cyclase